MMLFPKIEVFILQDNSIPIFMFTMEHKCLLQKENVPFKMHLSCHHHPNINQIQMAHPMVSLKGIALKVEENLKNVV